MPEPVAIVGIACRFPGQSTSPSKFWDLLKNPRDVLKDFTDPARPNLSRFHDHRTGYHGSTTVAGKSYLLSEDFRLFDAAFFNTNGREADGIDPQQRILLEVVYEALESAGWPLEQVSGTKTSVHVGVMNADYQDIAMRDSQSMLKYHATGTARSLLSNRISYFFNLYGLSVTLDTACSSSLVALHNAVQGLKLGETTAAIVAGANLLLDPGMFIAESALHMLSSDARSRMWDKSASGYARGEGFAALILKPLSKAISDGDRIEAVIRGTGANSDGHTPGITMPSASAQTELIRQTYQRAGLDPVQDGCDCFEAHGTGTLAGDPIEAEGIRNAFFPMGKGSSTVDVHAGRPKLPVCSVKTIVGHTEGCAGLAGVIKAILTIKNRTVPPNMHFCELNPKIAEFYDHLVVPTTLIPFRPCDRPLRVSVNGFGFGGTNAHAIIEGYGGENRPKHALKTSFIGPLLFSAHTAASLYNMVKQYKDYVEDHEDLNLDDLAWTLQTRRSGLAVRQHFTGSNRQQLLSTIQKFIADVESSPNAPVGLQLQSRDHDEPIGILGVFTGQGAQYATMGRQLLQTSPVFREALRRCEEVLAQLPDGPEWSLTKELVAEEPISRISEAALSQPLCTALQIGLIDLLRRADVHFDAVVGHSSGEIAATYAAGIIDAKAAIQIAYYRGFHACRARGSSGQKGRMLAVGVSYNDAQSFCRRDRYCGRITVAASNSPLSVTLSGDLDTIEEAKTHFDSQKIFARILKTDTAYHSSHMDPCGEPYLRSLRACNIQVSQPKPDCTWISSVRGDTQLLDEDLSSLSAQYWVDNMRSPVLFSQAVEWSHWHGGPFDFAIEVGPHPALKGPAEQTLKAATGGTPTYTGLMKRGGDEIEAFSTALGLLWAKLGPIVNFEQYRKAFEYSPDWLPCPLGDLPTYAWDHSTIHWSESRISRNYRLRDDKMRDLLGRRCADDSDESMRWRNVLKLNELPWLRGHVFQGQTLFPASGHIAMVLQAAVVVAGDRPIKLFELRDINLHRAIVLSDDSSGVETVLELRWVDTSLNSDVWEAEYTCFVCQDESSGSLLKAGSGRLVIVYGDANNGSFPRRLDPPSVLVDVDISRFYSTMSSIGLEYTELFHGLQSAARSLGYSRTSASWKSSDLTGGFVIHPASLDVVFQTLYLAFASPVSNDIWAPYLPVRIQRLAVDPAGLRSSTSGLAGFEADTYLSSATASKLEGDMHVVDRETQAVVAQVDGITMQVMAEPGPENDLVLFSSVVWEDDIFAERKCLELETSRTSDPSLVKTLDRACLYWWISLKSSTPLDVVGTLDRQFQNMFAAFDHLLGLIRTDRHPTVKREWLVDSYDTMMTCSTPYMDRADMRLIHVVGRNLPSVLRGEAQLLEIMLQDDLLNRFYMEGSGMSSINHAIAVACKQFAHKFPRARYLEIGAGTGGTTRAILDVIDQSFSSYTYTDISAGFFENASEKFKHHVGKMHFRTLDIEKDPVVQGFDVEAYDIIVAANVLHATSNMAQTLQHARKLLRPGGLLVLLETTGQDILMPQFIMGGLPGWWAGTSDGRYLTPALSITEWDKVLHSTGFSGVDHVVHDTEDGRQHTFSAIISQAVDETIFLLRTPLVNTTSTQVSGELLIVGGMSLQTAGIVNEIQELLPAWKARTRCVKDLKEIRTAPIAPMSSVICLADLDEPLFCETECPESFESLQELFVNAECMLWVKCNRPCSEPRSNMAVGVGRALKNEMPDLALQFLDFLDTTSLSTFAPTIVRSFLRLTYVSDLEPNVLWPAEPEVIVDGDRTRIPRVKPHSPLNDRCNADRRPITASLDARNIGIQLKLSQANPQFAGTFLSLDSLIPHDQCRIRIAASLQLPGGDDWDLHLVHGTNCDSGQSIIALSSKAASLLSIPQTDLVMLPDSVQPTPRLLHCVAAKLLSNIIDSCHLADSDTIFYEPPALVVRAVQGKNINLLTCDDSRATADWICIHPRASITHIKRILPVTVNRVFTFGEKLPHLIKAAIPSSCSIEPLVLAREILGHPELHRLLECSLEPPFSDEHAEISVIRVQAIADGARSYQQDSVLDWENMSLVTALVPKTDMDSLLSHDRTYLLLGLTGDLGLSLATWMINHGARNIVLASRNARVDKRWLAEAAAGSANVRLCKIDASDKSALVSAIEELRQTMPPISGVCNGTMLLADKLFADMDHETWNFALKPKVLGTKYLDEIFSDACLDFFIFFSSLGSIIGNINQSNYHAANLYASSLVANRRKRGLAGSVIHLSMVADVGHVAHHGQNMEKHLRNMFYMPLSERNVHNAFAEAIFGGRSNTDQASDIIVGCEMFHESPEAARRPPWEQNPIFSHMIVEDARNTVQRASGDGGADAMQALERADTEEAALSIIIEAFSEKIKAVMQLSAVNPNVPLVELGCDSLLAIEIRGWFAKELKVDVPVLKVLSGETVSQICLGATRKHLANRLLQAPAVSASKVDIEAEAKAGTIPPTVPAAENGDSMPHDVPSRIPSEPATSIKKTRIPDEDCTQLAADNGTVDEPAKYSEVARASLAQSRLWFLADFLEDATTLNVAVLYELTGTLDISRLRRALVTTIMHHKTFQTCYFEDPDKAILMQGIRASPRYHMRFIDEATEAIVAREYEALRTRTWDLRNGDTFGVSVLSRDPDSHVLIFAYHQMLMDGHSWHTFLRDLNLAYTMQPLNCHSRPYTDFAETQLRAVKEGKFQSHLQFWEERLMILPKTLPLLPLAGSTWRAPLDRYETRIVHRELDTSRIQQIRQCSQAIGTTPFHFHLAVVQALLVRFLRLEDVCIGIANNNRTDDKYSDTLGFFTNILPVKFTFGRDDTFEELVKGAQAAMYEALSHSDVPFDLILDRLRFPRPTTHSPLFQVAINYETGHASDHRLGESAMVDTRHDDARNAYDLLFDISETTSGSKLELIVQSQLYTMEAAEALADCYLSLLDSAAVDVSQKVRQLSIIGPATVTRALSIGQGPRVDIDGPDTIFERVVDVAQRSQDDLAMQDSVRSWTYRHLMQEVLNVAWAIHRKRTAPGSSVLVFCRPTNYVTASMLAVLRAGCVYVPLDPILPLARRIAILHDCGAALILCDEETQDDATSMIGSLHRDIELINIQAISRPSDHIVPIALAEPDDKAFVFYTSGSTGTFKGAVLTQAGYINHIVAKIRTLNLQRETVLQQSSIGYDMSLAQILCALLTGGTCVVTPASARADPTAIARIIRESNVTFTYGTPWEYFTLLQNGTKHLKQASTWKTACIGGEMVPDNVVNEFRRVKRDEFRLVNCYGTTETSIATTLEMLSLEPGEKNVPYRVGKTLPNYSVYIVNDEGELMPPNMSGEIIIAGAGVGLVYLGSDEQTRSKFIRNPWVLDKDTARGSTRMFRTGDRGYLLEDSSLVFVDRMEEFVVKLPNGLRVNLSDVANCIVTTSAGSIFHAVVTARGDPPSLVAHVLPSPGHNLNPAELKRICEELPLPQHMKPIVMVPLERLLLNSNGKIDREAFAALPLPQREVRPEMPDLGRGHSATETELRLVWERLLPCLGVDPISGDSDFFLSGGSSLLLTQLQGEIRKSMNVNVKVRDLYECSTLEEMATRITETRMQQTTTRDQIDWLKETAASQSLSASCVVVGNDESAPLPPQREVLLTGAASFLGQAVLNVLFRHPKVSRIHCVALSTDDSAHVAAHADSDRVVTYHGDLRAPLLGLSPADCAHLQATVDLILHAGHAGHCMNSYASVRVPNVLATRSLLDFAAPASIPLHFVSSNRVVLLSGQNETPPVSVADSFPPPDGSDGFVASKWACERLLENSATILRSLDIGIHRPCALMGVTAPNEDPLNTLVEFSRILRAVPTCDNFDGFVDFREKGQVAAELVENCLVPRAKDHDDGRSPVHFFHYSSGERVPFAEFAARLERLSGEGEKFEQVSVTEWIGRAEIAGLDPLVAGYLEAVAERGGAVRFPFMGMKADEAEKL